MLNMLLLGEIVITVTARRFLRLLGRVRQLCVFDSIDGILRSNEGKSERE